MTKHLSPTLTAQASAQATERPFTERHIGTDTAAQATMLARLGYDSVNALVAAAVPASIHVDAFRSESDTLLPPAASEREALAELRALAGRNTVQRSMIGLGYYDTITPAVIKRNVLENPSWYTAYTPYQPEISQGRLEALINFQTMIADLTGLHTANASMLDESTAVVEGMLLARRGSKSPSHRFLVDADALPQTKALLANRAAALGIELVETDFGTPGADAEPAAAGDADASAGLGDYFGVFVQYPGATGTVWNPAAVIEAAHAQGALAVVVADLLALTLIMSPGELGADVAVGTSQRFGVPMGFGGPHAGYLAVRKGLERQMPGRLVGVSVDAAGHPAYRLSLQVREQHIRRDKATSNICTAQVLLAVMAGMYAVYHGPDGLRQIARGVHENAGRLVAALRAADVTVLNDTFFDTVRVSMPSRAAEIVARASGAGVNLYQVDCDTIGISVDETTTRSDLAAVLGAFGGTDAFGHVDLEASVTGLPEELARTTTYLEHPVFNTHRSETSMMRYLKRLADYDYALDRGMIPLGSCTMKLNAATEMEAVSWPEFSGIHPFAPRDDVDGYLELIRQLETWLTDVTGYDSVSLQPNAGSQGELSGLLAIRGYHLANGNAERTICLIPSSAHGTNAASAVLAGMKVVVVACDDLGNVDLDDLRAKIAEHADSLAALMITYPSTHGVYEHEVGTICQAVHAAGGQVYVDGANLNALLGFARYGDFGGDVSHLNLHKTFCIPHGGGGPGVGPVAAKAHLAPFLPGHPLAQDEEHYLRGADGSAGTVVHGGGPVSAAPYGSPGILPISWAYVRMMGAAGLKQATGAAVLAANYVAKGLEGAYPLLYSGENGLVAHECILDLRPLTAATGVTVDDVAKRLVDYGFHAPTMSFPVSGTLMVEPTESEDLGEIDRFIEAMIAIKAEADAVAAGVWPADDNPLHNAPHTAQSVIEGEWEHAYDRETAVYPLRSLIRGKYWPPVRRIDNAFGDRNLVCACPPPEAFAD
ncbi:aminomethyl-transferring glycine dehydrogenase [Cryobacterium sp. 10S3]|uniref:aminomethyl-transferring glycine dehydrogenase n=3 Tax=Cryobacterium TaxID=69578 RepID=UPI002AB53177|nr:MULTISPECIES: aminomethyl-transferring glycine dehydrogenase [unclassified Cryobacterium]MDY7527044.1 aminomethyl-transferring glycine dehydrogenase [Cryobacterium sp. 10C2]MEB0287050.1 aminomethyl-transferring glycine dehydrogenase [Cryobacterium sp. 10S3]MEB0290170.1 aminomethyl-transferring glycine dehydrogenase [Cryobacterium sp. 10C2]WPX14511.1 aminomethyl-transferring glycine dehydrogenase [Cryobacterium sp. 10S3]